MASIPERDEEVEDDDEEYWAELTGPGAWVNQDQGSANSNIDEEESSDDGRDGLRDSIGPAAAPSEPAPSRFGSPASSLCSNKRPSPLELGGLNAAASPRHGLINEGTWCDPDAMAPASSCTYLSLSMSE
jgi:hypothetical protein